MTLSNDILRSIRQTHGGAFYLLDTCQFATNFKELEAAFRHYYPETYIAYSYKTNYTPRLCKLVDELGGYAEVVSDMEYEIARRLGIATNKVHFNGPYKNTDAHRRAARAYYHRKVANETPEERAQRNAERRRKYLERKETKNLENQ